VANVQCSFNDGDRQQGIAELRGEVLLFGSKPNTLKPVAALGGLIVAQTGKYISVTSPATSTSLGFSTEAEARAWGAELKEVSARQPEVASRIHDLVCHVVKQEKLHQDKDRIMETRKRAIERKHASVGKKEADIEPDGLVRSLQAVRARLASHSERFKASGAPQDTQHKDIRHKETAEDELVKELKDRIQYLESFNWEETIAQLTNTMNQVTMERDRNEKMLREMEKASKQQARQDEVKDLARKLHEVTLQHNEARAQAQEHFERADALVQEREGLFQQMHGEREAMKQQMEAMQAKQFQDISKIEADYQAQIGALERQWSSRPTSEEHDRIAQQAAMLEAKNRELEQELFLTRQNADEILRASQAGFDRTQALESELNAMQAEAARAHQGKEEFIRLNQAGFERTQALESELNAMQAEAARAHQEKEEMIILNQAGFERTQVLESELIATQTEAARAHQEKELALTSRIQALESELSNHKRLAAEGDTNLGKLAAVEEENKLLKDQMASTWAQINEQMARLDEERSRYLEDVRAAKAAAVKPEAMVLTKNSLTLPSSKPVARDLGLSDNPVPVSLDRSARVTAVPQSTSLKVSSRIVEQIPPMSTHYASLQSVGTTPPTTTAAYSTPLFNSYPSTRMTVASGLSTSQALPTQTSIPSSPNSQTFNASGTRPLSSARISNLSSMNNHM